MNVRDADVWIVDDEPDVVDALALLLRSGGYSVVRCQSGRELLDQLDVDALACIVLDMRMPEMSGFEVQRELQRRGYQQPVVFLSGHGDIPMAVQAMRAGALEFLEKPVRGAELFAAVDRGLEVARSRHRENEQRRAARELLESLSQRENDVADLLRAGLRSREIAERLELSPRTVEMHRARLLKRVGARTAAEAVRIIQGARALLRGDQKRAESPPENARPGPGKPNSDS